MYIPSINILRGLAALMVCLYHFTNYSDRYGAIFSKGHWIQELGELGINGVFVFFVISGCVIPLSLHKYQFSFKKIGRFLWKRWIRIELPYFASIVAVLMVGFAFALKENQSFVFEVERFFHHLIYTVLFIDHEWYNPIYWTLAIEFQFYILVAILCLVMMQQKQVVRLLIIALFACASLLVDDNRVVLNYAPIFALGMLYTQHKIEPVQQVWYYGLLILFAGIIAYVHTPEIAIFSALTVLVIQFMKDGPKLGHQLGDMSYSLYLTHGIIGGNILYLTSRHVDHGLLKVLLILGVTAISVIGAHFFWKWIEKPSQKWSQKVKL